MAASAESRLARLGLAGDQASGLSSGAVNRRRYLAVVALIAATYGCAPQQQYVWIRSDYTPELFARDRYDCLAQARYVSEPTYIGTPMRGGGAIVSPVGGGLAYDDTLFRACMEARGWTLTPVPQPPQ